MELEDLKNLQAFLQRVQLSGAEVPAWVKASNALAVEVARLTTPQPPPNVLPE